MALRHGSLVYLALAASACGGGELNGDVAFQPGVRLCEAKLGLAGTWTQGAPQPVDVVGCWPVGLWSFSAVVQENGCGTAPVIQPKYEFQVVRDEESNETYTYVNDPAYERIRMKVTSGGGGLCSGSFSIYSADGTEILNLKPMLNADTSINGFAEYSVYGDDQWN